MTRTVTSVGLYLCVMIFTIAQPARADIITFFDNPNGYQSALNEYGITDENVLFNTANAINGPATIVRGETNQSGVLINVEGTEPLTATGGFGQATVDAADGSFDYFRIYPQLSTLSFQSLFFDIDAVNSLQGTPVTFTTLEKDGTFGTYFTVLTPGLTSAGFVAINGQALMSVTTQSVSQAFDELRHIRVGFGSSTPPPPPTPVPEPASVVLLGAGLAGLATRLRRKRNVQPEAN